MIRRGYGIHDYRCSKCGKSPSIQTRETHCLGIRPSPRSREPRPIDRAIAISGDETVKELAEKLGVRAKEVISFLLSRGTFATISQKMDRDLIVEVSRFFGVAEKER